MKTLRWLLVSATGSVFLMVCLWSMMVISVSAQKTPDTSHINDLTLVNQIGGSVSAVIKQGNYAYVGMGPRLHIVDVQDPTQPVALGQTEVLSGTVSRIVIAGNYAYVGVGIGIGVIDITNPSAPTQVSFYDTPGTVYGLVVSGTFVYVAEGQVWDGIQYNGGGLRILDILIPFNPVEVGFFNANAFAFGVSILGDYAYVSQGSGTARILIIDISNPNVPNLVNFVNILSQPKGSTVNDNYLYVAQGSEGVSIYSLASPQNPTWVSYYDSPSTSEDVTVDNNRAYIADTYSGMTIVDVSNPLSPTLLGIYTLPGAGVLRTDAEGAYVYVAYERNGLRIVDVTDPTLPLEVSVYDIYGYSADVAINNGYSYLLDLREGVHVLDIADEATPSPVGFYNVTSGVDIKSLGNYTYFTRGSSLFILDVTNPTTPTLVIQHPLATGTAFGLAIADHYAYVAAYSGGLQVVDIADPQIPINIGSLPLANSVRYVAVANGYAYVADAFDYNMYVIDVTAPATPTLVSTYVLTNTVYGIDVSGDYVYLAHSGLGLHVVDVSDPTQPVQAGVFHTGEYADYGDVEVVGEFAYMGEGKKVRLIDVSDPLLPMQVDSYTTADYVEDLAVTNQYVYVANGGGGLMILGGGTGEPTLSVNNASVYEGDTETAVLTFTVTVDASTTPTQTITVEYATADSTATANSDYIPVTGTLTFLPGETTQTITVTVIGDTELEPNETVFINLSDITNAVIADGQGIGTILNDDEVIVVPDVSITDSTVQEGDSGTETAVFTVTLSAVSTLTATVDYATADETAESGSDYTPLTGTLVFAPGVLTQTITITITGDTQVETDEAFLVNLSNPYNITILDGQGVGVILNDDQAVVSYAVYLPIAVRP